MKSIAIALLLGVASSKKLHKKDAPQYFNEPTWNEKFASATGFAEQKDAPQYFNEPTWNEKFPSATGFSQDRIQGPPFFNEPAFNDRMPAGAGFM